MGPNERREEALDLAELIAAITSVVSEPYTTFLTKLHAENASLTLSGSAPSGICGSGSSHARFNQGRLLQAHSEGMPPHLSGRA